MKKSFTIHDLPPAERPRERLVRLGPEALSAQEILALILGRGVRGESVMVTAQKLLSKFGSLQGIADSSVEELSEINGIGPAKATQLKAAFELGRRLEATPSEGKAQVKSPEDVVNVVGGRLKGKKREYFLTLLLDTRNRLIRVATVSMGSLDSSIVHPREVFKEAISASAASVIFVHNHPGGDCTPSEMDKTITRALILAARAVNIMVFDHLIVSTNGYYSLRENGLV